MSVAGLRYQASTYSAAPVVTKNGVFIFDGSPANYHEWQFRTELRIAACEQKCKKLKRERESKRAEDSFTSSSKPETGKKERSPKHRPPGSDLERGPRSESSVELFNDNDALKPGDDANDDDDEELEAEQRMETVLRVLEGLRGDAFQKAKDLGVAALSAKGGLERLVEEIKLMVFPLGALEAQALFRSGQAVSGPLSRQPTESVVSYIGRRRRWWNLMQQLDPRIQLSDSLRAELLLELSGLTKDQQLMVKACAGKANGFEDYAKVLTEHHGTIHLRGYRMLSSGAPKGGKDPGGKGFGKGSKGPKGFGKSAYQAYEEEAPQAYLGDYDPVPMPSWSDTSPGHEGSESPYEGYWAEYDVSYEHQPAHSGYLGVQEDPEVSDEEIAVALNCMEECELAHPESPASSDAYAAFAEAVQLQCAAYAALGKASGKGKSKGKFPGKPSRFPVVKSQLSIEDRKKRLQEIKSKSKCLKCGQIGHWSGDPICPKGRGAGQANHNKPPQAAKPQAFMAELSESSEDEPVHRNRTFE